MVLLIKNLSASTGDKKLGVQSLGWVDPLEEGMEPTPVFLPGEYHEQRTLVGFSPVRKELDTAEANEHARTQ